MLKVADSAVPVACWSCSVAHNESTLFCPHCSKIQPPPAGDYFSVFGLQPRFHLDLAALELEFHRLSRKLHPDRFARAQKNERQWSLAGTALLNDAYRTLKDPLRRTEYVLKIAGANASVPAAPAADPPSSAATNGKEKDRSRAPAGLLEKVFDLNLQLEEMRAASDMGKEDPALKEKLAAAKMKFDSLLGAVDRDLRVQWTAWDAGDAAARLLAQQAMVVLLERRRYLSNLVRDVSDILGA